MIESLQAKQTDLQAYLYFYFDFTDIEKRSFEKCICCLAHQLYDKDQNARKYLDKLYLVSDDGKNQPSIDVMANAFEKMLKQVGKVWIVLDALDECVTRTELLIWLRSLIQNPGMHGNIHILVTSRPEQDIKIELEGLAGEGQVIAINDDLLEADISNYVHMRVRGKSQLQRWQDRPDILRKIETTLIEKANGM